MNRKRLYTIEKFNSTGDCLVSLYKRLLLFQIIGFFVKLLMELL